MSRWPAKPRRRKGDRVKTILSWTVGLGGAGLCLFHLLTNVPSLDGHQGTASHDWAVVVAMVFFLGIPFSTRITAVAGSIKWRP